MSALGAAISGLQGSQKWLDVISNNISNSNTVAYKEGRLSFADLISTTVTAPSGPDSTNNLGGVNPSQLGLGVTVGSIQTIMNQGAIQTTGNATDIAINGSGFFAVSKGSQQLYTRAGNLTFDEQGNLVTTDGGLVQGWQMQITRTPVGGPIAAITGPTINTSGPTGNIQIPANLVLPPKATSNQLNPTIKGQGVDLAGNLDSNTPANLLAPLAAGYIPDATTSFTVHDSLGAAYTIEAYFTKTGAPGVANWTVNFYNITGGAVPAAANAVGNGALTFNADGSLATEPGGANNMTINIPNPSPTALALAVSVNFGTDNAAAAGGIGLRDGMTSDAGGGTYNSLGVYQPVQSPYTASVDGYAQGTLTGLSVTQTGGVSATFSNGQIVTVADIAIATFTNPSGLDKVGDNYYQQTADSGQAQISQAGFNGAGTTQGGALESSNVDLSVELTNMILAQRMFESNAKVITTASSLLSTLINAVPAQ